jgi:Ca-activated chloride channel homolog
MKAIFLWKAALFLVLANVPPSYGQQANPREPQATIRVKVDRVNVGVIVTDGAGKFVEGLRRDDFHVFDNGVEQPLTNFVAVEEPAQVLLLIEAGPAVYLLESGHLQAANALLNGLSAEDRVAVVRYDEVPRLILDFTADKLAAGAALSRLQYNLGFGALNLSSSVHEVLGWLNKVQGKKTIVLLSTGVDTTEPQQAAAAIQLLRISDVRLLAVSLAMGLQDGRSAAKKKYRAPTPPQLAEQFEQANELLRRIADATGGRAYFPVNSKEFDAAYAEIAQLIRHEYSLAFAPPLRDGLVHTIEVRIDPLKIPTSNTRLPSYRLDHRRAYLAPVPAVP